MYRHIPLVALSLLSSLFLAACGNGTPPPAAARPAIVVQPQPAGADLAGKGLAHLPRRLVEVGERVKKDQPLAELDPQDVRLQLEAARAQVSAAEANLLTILKLLPLLLVGILGWFHFNPEHLAIPARSELPNMGYAQAIATTAALTLWSFIGLESATVPADDVEDPRRTIPRATLFGTLAAAALYILSITAVQGLMPPEVLARSTSPFADAARILMGDWGYYLVAAGAVIACLGALNGWVLLQGQIPVAPARDGLFPESLGQLNKNGAPAHGLLASGLLVTALVMVDGHGDLVDVFNVIILLGTMTGVVPYAFCTAALLQLLAVRPDEFSPRSRRQLLVIGSLGFAYSLWALYGTGQQAIFWGFLVLMAGIPMYTWRQWRNQVNGVPTLKAND
ncbi:amino acid permease [Pseudomonas aeruginosa]|nr:amino acid permease [Pseudomonas aeruginosa]